MRDVLGHFATGVVVVTARAPGGDPLGFTCQSFASLSLEPPLVSFAPARSSTTWPRIRDIGAFCVNVLSAEHRDLSVGFARSGLAVDKFAGVSWCPAPSGAPVLERVSAWVDASCQPRDQSTPSVTTLLPLFSASSSLPASDGPHF